MTDQDYQDHLKAARSHRVTDPERMESALTWAAVTAACSIADSLKAQVQLAKDMLTQMEHANAMPAPAETPESAGLPDVVTDGEGDIWLRVVGGDRYVCSDPGVKLNDIRQRWGIGGDQR